MRGWNSKIIDRLPNPAGFVKPYGEIDLSDPDHVYDAEACVMVRLPPAPRADFNTVKVPGPVAAPRNAVVGSRWEVWVGRTRLWVFVQPDHRRATDEMERLADIVGYPVRDLRLRVQPAEVEVRDVDRTDEIAQKTSMVRLLLLGNR